LEADIRVSAASDFSFQRIKQIVVALFYQRFAAKLDSLDPSPPASAVRRLLSRWY